MNIQLLTSSDSWTAMTTVGAIYNHFYCWPKSQRFNGLLTYLIVLLTRAMQTTNLPTGTSPHIRNIALDLILTLLTCYLYNGYVQYVQIKAVNDMLQEERYSFFHWSILTLVTCGLYHVYHEYRMTTDIAKLNGESGSTEALISILLSVFGLSLIVDAIQQSHINRYYGSSKL